MIDIYTIVAGCMVLCCYIIIMTPVIIGLILLWRSIIGKNSKIPEKITKKTYHENIDENLLLEVKDYLKKKKFKQDQDNPEIWYWKLFAATYFVRIIEGNNKIQFQYWWQHRWTKDKQYPIDYPYWASIHYRLLRHSRKIHKIINRERRNT